MSLVSLLERGGSRRGTDKVQAAYDAMPEEERKAFRTIIKDQDQFTAPEVAAHMGGVTGDQVKRFRQKLREGRAQL